METNPTAYLTKVGKAYKTRRLGLGQYGLLLAFLGICVVLSFITPKFLTVQNLMIIVTQVSINALLAFGVTFVIITGGIDLSIGQWWPSRA
jgi:inositol transport system permease protein